MAGLRAQRAVGTAEGNLRQGLNSAVQRGNVVTGAATAAGGVVEGAAGLALAPVHGLGYAICGPTARHMRL